jgi:hypothetical protein
VERTFEISERLKNLGFRIATKSGFSIGIEDLLIPPEKQWRIQLTERKVKKNKLYERLGAVTLFETEERLVTGFIATSESLKSAIVEIFQEEDPLNPLYLISFSGARGNLTQIRQLIGIRGLIIDPIGRVLKSPIRSNFKEGITLTEFLLSCYGARKGIIDTALRTAKAGYLTRRLVDMSHFQVISIRDCNTRRRIRIFPLINTYDQVLMSLHERIRGRSLAYPIPKFGCRNLSLNVSLSQQVRKKYPFALFRSALLCRAPFLSILRQLYLKSKKVEEEKKENRLSQFLPWRFQNRYSYFTLCQCCYGWNLADGNLINLGEAIGILAAQSIGEPGTQLTIRTFHTGGVFSSGVLDTLHRSVDGQVFFPKILKGRFARSSTGQIGFLTRESGTICLQTYRKKNPLPNKKNKLCIFSTTIRVEHCPDKKVYIERDLYLPQGVLLLVRQREWITVNSTIAFIGILRTLCDEDIQIRTYRTPHRREISFEEVTLTKVYSLIEKDSSEKLSPQKFWSILSFESCKKIRTVNFSRIVLKSSELLGKRKNHVCPFLFSWKHGDLIGSNSSLTKVRVTKPTKYLTFPIVNNKNELIRCWRAIMNGYRILFYKSGYLFLSSKKTYRNLFSQGLKSPTTTFFIRKSIKRCFFQTQFHQTHYVFKTFPILVTKQTEENIVLGISSFFVRVFLSSKKFYVKRSKWIFPKFPLSILFVIDRKYRKKKMTFIIKTNYVFILLKKSNIKSLVYNLFFSKKIKIIWFHLQLPLFYLYKLTNAIRESKRRLVAGLLLFHTTPSLRKKIGFILNKQICSWAKINIFHLFYYLKQKTVFALNMKKNSSFVFKKNSFLGIVSLCYQISRKLLVLKLFEGIKKNYFSRYNWSMQIVKKQRKNTSRVDKNAIFFYFLTKRAAEIYQNSSSKEFFFLTKNQLKRYTYVSTKKIFFNGFWQKSPIYIKEGLGTREIGQRIAFEQDVIILRQETQILLEANSFFPWKSGSILPYYTPLTVKRGRVSETRDITSGIPRIDILLEIRTQTGLPSLLESLCKDFLKQGFSNGVATRKATHFAQRVLIDRVQRIYKTNGVTLDDKHLELLIRPTSFAQVIQDHAQENLILQGEKHPLEILERLNYTRVVKNWKKKNFFMSGNPELFIDHYCLD